MTTQPGDHFRHPHLDNGQCLDGSGQNWSPEKVIEDHPSHITSRAHLDGICGCPLSRVEARKSLGYRVLSPAEVSLRRHVDTLTLYLLVLTFAVVLLGTVVVLLAVESVGS